MEARKSTLIKCRKFLRIRLPPAELGKPMAALIILDSLPHVRNRIARQAVHRVPPQFIAFMRFGVVERTRPFARRQEEINAFRIRATMHDAHHLQMSWVNLDAAFLFGFANHRDRDGLSVLHVTGRHAVMPIFVTRVETPEEQDLMVANQEQVYSTN